MNEHDGCKGCLHVDAEADSIYCRGCVQNAIDKYVTGPEEEHDRELDACAREIEDLRKKVDYWQAQAIKNAAELGELKIKAAQKDAGNIQEALNNLPDSLIGKRVWICYCNIILPGNIQSYEVDNEGTKVLVGTDGIGCIECRPENIHSTVFDAMKVFNQTTI